MIYSLPLIAAIIGWLTNYIAVKMLFHPKKPVRLLFLTVQGVFPKRQKSLAEKLGKIVADELFNIEDIKDVLLNNKNQDDLNQLIESHIDHFLRNKLSDTMPMLAMFMGDETRNMIKNTLMAEIKIIMPEVINTYVRKIEQEIDIEKTVYDKVVNFSTEKLESILFSIMKKEFKFIELVGAILGFLIGSIQLAITFV